MRRLILIKSEEYKTGFYRYTRQDTGCFVCQSRLRRLENPKKVIRDPNELLEDQDFFYDHDNVFSPETNALVYSGKGVEVKEGMVYFLTPHQLLEPEEQTQDYCVRTLKSAMLEETAK